MPDIGRTEPPVRVLDEISKFDIPPPLEFQNDVVDSMSPPHTADYVWAQHELAQDRATLQLIDDEIEECRMRIRSLERQRDGIQRRVTIYRARLSPLRVVPDQILQEIFQHCLPDTPYIVPSMRTAPMVLTHVCRRWRVVAQGTSELWSSIALIDRGIWNLELKVEMAKRWLDRSRMRPIRMCITCPPHTDFGLGGNALRSDIFRLVIVHGAQLSNVCLNVNRTYLRHFMDRARLPALRSIVISPQKVRRIDEPPEPITPPLISAPNLKHVAFKGNETSIDLIPRTLFPQITHLTFDCNMTLDLALLFQDFPNLEHLTLVLSHSRDALRFRQPPQSDHKVVSPSLLCLEVCLDKEMLDSDRPTKLETVLDQLELPTLETLVLAAPLRSRFQVRTGRTEEASWENHATWVRSPSVASLLSRSRHAHPRFERRDLASSLRAETWI